MNDIGGIPGFQGGVGTAPHIALGTTTASTIGWARVYGDAMFRWLMAKMEEAQELGNDSDHAYYLSRCESFNEDFFGEMKKHFTKLAGRAEIFSKKDMEIYREQAMLFDFLLSLIN